MSVQSEGYRNESFESLEAAVLETQRGRWFLEEYARRQRSAETLAILEILKKLENSITSTSFLPPAKSPEPVPSSAPALKTEQLKFFKQDEEIFVEPTIAAPALSVVSSPAKVEVTPPREPVAPPSEPKGAKLKIQRLPVAAIPEDMPNIEPEMPGLTTLVEDSKASIAPQPAAEAKQRVVIIRRPASEAAEIPLMEEKSAEVAA
ncbi:MAG: hypothetical protein IT541_07330 [Hyphomicrobiales bacterium]|jgi:hypothetical protein|nr:hypothetical protein [Hyphomicrobiales bacterium]